LAFTPDGRFLFTGSGGIATLVVDPSAGAITQRAFLTGTFAANLAVDSTGRFLYAPDITTKTVKGFAIAADGTLTSAGIPPSFGTPDGFVSRGLAILRDLVYVSNQRANLIYGYLIDETSGALTPVAGSPVSAESPFKLAAFSALPATVTLDAGDPFAGAYGAFGGQPPYTWSVTAGSLPPGLSLNTQTGAVSGTAGGTGAYSFTLSAADSSGAAAAASKTIAVAGDPATAATVSVIEFYNQSLDHYFITYVADEIAKLDNGTFKGWTRTGLSFKAFGTVQSATSAVCRIYIPPGKGDGHFFGRDTNECDGTMTKHPDFILESSTFLYLFPPTLGNCAAATVPVYRVYSNRADANHRYTTSRTVREQMVAKGWLAEGDGADIVVMCAPQ
jgi:hypothetical protein